MVGQEQVLYARSLSENIAYGLLESEWSQDDVQEAAKLPNAHMFVCCKYFFFILSRSLWWDRSQCCMPALSVRT